MITSSRTTAGGKAGHHPLNLQYPPNVANIKFDLPVSL